MTTLPIRVNRTRGLANLMAQSALQPRQITHPLQGLGQIAQAAMGAFLMRKADRQEEERRAAANEALMALMGGSADPGAAAAAGATPTAGAATPGLTALAGGGGAPAPGGGGPSISALLSTAQQFPELAPVINPMISARMTPRRGVVVGPGGAILDPTTGETIGSVPAAEKAPTLREVADPTSPTGTRLVDVREALGQPGVPRQEFRMETITDPTGETRTIMVRGRPGAAEATGSVSKPTRAKLEQSIVEATERVGRIGAIRQSVDAQMLKLPEQIRQGGLAIAEKMGIELSPENRQSLKAYTRARTSTIRNMNKTLNELSGAAISPAEAKRLKAELPTMDDSPSQFAAKLESIEDSLQAAIRRNQQLLESGVTELTFDKSGEIMDAPDLDTFILDEMTAAGPVEAGMAGTAATPPPPRAVNPDTGEAVIWNGTEWVPE